MKIQSFLEHYDIASNPFAEEDAQTDPVFKDHCIDTTYHPAWDKVFGNPAEPSTSVVFGEKGAGKTAMRLQIVKQIGQFNRDNARAQVYVIEYDDFNSFLDRFRDRVGTRRRRAEKVLDQWHLWDHMDAILSLGVTSLIDQLLEVKQPSGNTLCRIDVGSLESLDRHQARDLLLLAACYDQSTAATFKGRWHRLRRKLKFWSLRSQWPLALGGITTLATTLLVIWMMIARQWELLKPFYLYLAMLLAGWAPWLWKAWNVFRQARGVVRRMRTGNHDTHPLREVLMHFRGAELSGQPLPNKDRTDDRFELLGKLQGVLKSLGVEGIIVLVDRVDEPHLINGSAELMRHLVWPLLDNKFLKHPGLGVKLMLPIELCRFIDREDRDFYQRARLDKQNMIPSLEWTGEALLDVANARIRACASDGSEPSLRDLFDESVSDRRMTDAFRSLRVPRHLFKFLYRVLVEHCNAHTDHNPCWKISGEAFESVLAVYGRQQEAFELGQGTG